MDNTINSPETQQSLPQDSQQEPPIQTLTNKVMTALSELKTKFIAYREQKAREKMQRVQLDVTKQQWGEGEIREPGKTTNMAPPKAAPPPKPPKVEGLH